MPNRQLRELGAKLTAAWTQPLFDEELVLLGELLQQFGPDSVPTAFELLQSKALAALVRCALTSVSVMLIPNSYLTAEPGAAQKSCSERIVAFGRVVGLDRFAANVKALLHSLHAALDAVDRLAAPAAAESAEAQQQAAAPTHHAVAWQCARSTAHTAASSGSSAQRTRSR